MVTSEGKRYDVFLSYNSTDGTAVKELANRLRREGLVLFVDDRDESMDRHVTSPAIESLFLSKTCVVLLGSRGLGQSQIHVLQIANESMAERGEFRIIPVLLPGGERPRRGDVVPFQILNDAPWVEFPKTIGDDQAFRGLIGEIRGGHPPSVEAAWHDGACPYRGLEAFRAEDAKFFFGRDSLTEWLISALRREVHEQMGVRFLGLLGPLGSGKSSLVQAGLIPRLKAGAIDGSEQWPVAVLKPGDDPLLSLAKAVTVALESVGHVALNARDFAAKLSRDPKALDFYVRMALMDEAKALRFVVVVDQFEEIFASQNRGGASSRIDATIRSLFFDNLLDAASSPGGRVVTVVTIRSEFYSACIPYSRLAAVLAAHQEMIGPMNDKELRAAVEFPALLAGCELEPGLTDMLVDDAIGQSAIVPTLQFTLTELWKMRVGRMMTHAAYRTLGRLEGVLGHQAERVFQKLNPEEQELCRRVFMELVQPSETTDDTKRRLSLSDLLVGDPSKAEAVRDLVIKLSQQDTRLITIGPGDSDGAQVEIAHEALIMGWLRLRKWVDQQREDLRFRKRLLEDSALWRSASLRDRASYLYKMHRLEAARNWQSAHRHMLSATETEFLASSEHAERIQRFRSHLMIVSPIALLVVFAFYQANSYFSALAKWENKANKLTTLLATTETMRLAALGESESRRLAALSESEKGASLDLSVLLAIEALRKGDTREARASLFDALSMKPYIESFFQVREARILSAVFSPDGTILATVYHSRNRPGGMVFWDLHNRSRMREPVDVLGDINSLTFRHDAKIVAVSNPDGISVFDLTSGEWWPDRFEVPEGDLHGLTFDPDAKVIAAGSGGSVLVWDLEKPGSAPKSLDVSEGKVTFVAFNARGTILAAGYADDRTSGIVFWDMEKRTRLEEGVKIPVETVTGIAFAPDGRTLAASFSDNNRGGVILYGVERHTDLIDRIEVRLTDSFETLEGGVTGITFAPDGRSIAAGYLGLLRGAIVWDLGNRSRLQEISSDESDVWTVGFGFDGKPLAAAFRNDGSGEVALCSLAKPTSRFLAASREMKGVAVESVAVRSDGETLVARFENNVSSDSNDIIIFDITGKMAVNAKLQAPQYVTCFTFNPDVGIAAAGSDRGVFVWDLERPRSAVENLDVPEGKVSVVAFNARGTVLAAGYSNDGTSGIVFWDMEKRTRQAERLEISEGVVTSIAFAPDGRTLATAYCGDDRDSGGAVLWDFVNRSRLSGVQVHDGAPSAVAFNPRDASLVIGYVNEFTSGFSLWRQPFLERSLCSIHLPTGSVKSLSFSLDGKTLAVGYRSIVSADSGVNMYDLDLDSWVKKAKRFANRNMTSAERMRFFPTSINQRALPWLPSP